MFSIARFNLRASSSGVTNYMYTIIKLKYYIRLAALTVNKAYMVNELYLQEKIKK
jgi:hypothetical protein